MQREGDPENPNRPENANSSVSTLNRSHRSLLTRIPPTVYASLRNSISASESTLWFGDDWALLSQGLMLKKLLEAIKELVTDANFDCSETGIALQAMDNSHVALISLLLSSEIFATYRCDRGFSLGVNLTSLNKLLRCAGNDDSITLKADDNSPETLSMSFSAPKHLSIPETEYHAIVSLPSAEFQRVCRDMMVIGETVYSTSNGISSDKHNLT
ncbi:4355_t:CDS:2 [Entrophospora sp. SA101]|nr:4355_t:CDS:2 [Entrophospora sp. SA101]